MTKLAFFSSPIGLGHATRDVAIAQNFKNILPIFITGNGAAEFFKKYKFDVMNVYEPPQFIVENGLLQNKIKWLWRYYQFYKNCKNISSQIISDQKSQIIVSDEDFASLSIAQEKKIPTVLITDILETKFVKGIGSLIEKKMNQSMTKIIKKCDIVILPEFGPDSDNIRRVGPIVREIKKSREELRKQFSFDKKTIVISVGGTKTGEFLIEKTINSLSKIDNVDVVLVSGPSIKKKYPGVKNLGFVSNLHELIFAADLLVSLAGKSTIDEAKAFGTPGIFIPIKGHFEQEDNARDEGFVHEDLLRLDSLIYEKLTLKRNPMPYEGAKKASAIIESLLK